MGGPDRSAILPGSVGTLDVLKTTSNQCMPGTEAKQGAGMVGRVARATSTCSALTITTGSQHVGAPSSDAGSAQHSISSPSQHGALQVGTPITTVTKTARKSIQRVLRNFCIWCKTNDESAKMFFLIFGHTIRTEAR